MAEGVFRSLTNHPSHPLISDIDSAGTGGYHIGAHPDSRTTKVLRKNGITDYSHAARKVVSDDFDGRYDYILGMDADNVEDLKALYQRAKSRKGKAQQAGAKEPRIMLFGEFGGRGKEEVVDPYYGADNGFDVAYEQMVRFTDGFLKHLEKEQEKL